MCAVLSGYRVLVTRPSLQAGPWYRALESAGATVVAYPTIEVGPPPSWEPLDQALAALASYDWLVFTSAAAARYTHQRLSPQENPSQLTKPRVAAVGGETARVLTALGFRVSLIPERQSQDGLIAHLAELASGARVLFPQAIAGRDELTLALRARGIVVDVVPASATTPLPHLPAVPPFDVSTFASPSALTAFLSVHWREPLAAAPLVAIGPTTAAAARAQGFSPHVADSPRIDALIATIAAARAASHPSQGAR